MTARRLIGRGIALGLAVAVNGAVPVTRSATACGVRLRHVMTVNLSAGTIDHVVNGMGDAADTNRIGMPVYVSDYP